MEKREKVKSRESLGVDLLQEQRDLNKMLYDEIYQRLQYNYYLTPNANFASIFQKINLFFVNVVLHLLFFSLKEEISKLVVCYGVCSLKMQPHLVSSEKKQKFPYVIKNKIKSLKILISHYHLKQNLENDLEN